MLSLYWLSLLNMFLFWEFIILTVFFFWRQCNTNCTAFKKKKLQTNNTNVGKFCFLHLRNTFCYNEKFFGFYISFLWRLNQNNTKNKYLQFNTMSKRRLKSKVLVLFKFLFHGFEILPQALLVFPVIRRTTCFE